MFKSKVLVGIVLICYLLFAIFEFSGNEGVAFYFNSFIVPLITLIYVFFVERKSKLFLLFLLFYSLSDILDIIIGNMPFDESQLLYDFEYYVGNALYIFAYFFLVIQIAKSLNLIHVIKHFTIHLIVLSILNVYLLYVLHAIIDPNLVLISEFYLELTYNVVMLSLLSIALLNYFYKDNKKSLYLFLGALLIVFSEVINVAYIYVTQICLLNFLATTLTLVAFYFFFQQSKLLNITNEKGKYIIIE